MKRFLASICLGLTLLTAPITFQSCKEIPTAGQPSASVVVDAEKTLRISKDTFDIFLKLEKQNHDLVVSKFPQIHQFAEYLRANAPTWLIQANDLKNQYKHGTGNLTALLNILSILKQSTAQAQTDITTIHGQ